VTNGYTPACAKTCPTGAIRFGARNDLVTVGQARVGELKTKGRGEAYLYGERELGGLGVMYVLEDKPDVYGLPEAPRMATKNVLGSWFSGILTAGIVAAVPFWLLFRRKEALAVEQAAKEGGE
jgi:formate dehydrogenase iron-sulfur subunit